MTRSGAPGTRPLGPWSILLLVLAMLATFVSFEAPVHAAPLSFHLEKRMGRPDDDAPAEASKPGKKGPKSANHGGGGAAAANPNACTLSGKETLPFVHPTSLLPNRIRNNHDKTIKPEDYFYVNPDKIGSGAFGWLNFAVLWDSKPSSLEPPNSHARVFAIKTQQYDPDSDEFMPRRIKAADTSEPAMMADVSGGPYIVHFLGRVAPARSEPQQIYDRHASSTLCSRGRDREEGQILYLARSSPAGQGPHHDWSNRHCDWLHASKGYCKF